MAIYGSWRRAGAPRAVSPGAAAAPRRRAAGQGRPPPRLAPCGCTESLPSNHRRARQTDDDLATRMQWQRWHPCQRGGGAGSRGVAPAHGPARLPASMPAVLLAPLARSFSLLFSKVVAAMRPPPGQQAGAPRRATGPTHRRARRGSRARARRPQPAAPAAPPRPPRAVPPSPAHWK